MITTERSLDFEWSRQLETVASISLVLIPLLIRLDNINTVASKISVPRFREEDIESLAVFVQFSEKKVDLESLILVELSGRLAEGLDLFEQRRVICFQLADIGNSKVDRGEFQ